MPVAFVTGGASGIGRSIVERLARDGFAIAIADIDVDGAGTLAGKVESEAIGVRCDVTSIDEVKAAAETVAGALGPVDVLVNNAGYDRPGFFLQGDPASWQHLLDVTLNGVLNCTYVLAPPIAARAAETGYGRIVNIASDAGRVGSMGEAVYSAAKGGAIAFTKSMARELARNGVTVNAVCPGPAETPMTDLIRTTEIGEKFMQRMVQATPLRRLAQPEEVAALVSYFTSEDARFTTGQVVSVSGGLTMSG